MMLFITTLHSLHYGKLVGNATKNFTDLIILGEMIETTIKAGKIMTGECSTRKKPGMGKKKKLDPLTMLVNNIVKDPFCITKTKDSKPKIPILLTYQELLL